MSAPGIDARVLEALQQASSLELYQLSTVIERLLADPRRILAVRKDLHLGQTVRFVDWRDGSLREGKVVAMRDTQVTLHELRERREWKLPYAAIEPPQPDRAVHPLAAEPEPPQAPQPTRDDFRRGEKVAFEDKYEPPRVSRRLPPLRRWSHEEVSEFFPRGPRARRAHGVGASRRA